LKAPATKAARLDTAARVQAVDYRSAFDLAPVGMLLSRQRLVVDCNHELLAMFCAQREELIGQSLEVLYPTAAEFERTGLRIAAQLDAQGHYADERVMKRLGRPPDDAGNGGRVPGQLFWCHVSGRALDPRQPHARGIWVFEDLSSKRVFHLELTPREREISALLIQGLTSKMIGRRLQISPRTVDVHRARLMRKTQASSAAVLVTRLLTGS
jgi:DNA-binding CsgD family transcriptional regulator